jgi:hypothetical protein
MGFFGFGKIRSVHPSVLEKSEASTQDRQDRQSEPSAEPSACLHSQRRAVDVPVMHEEVLGIRRAQFPALPTAVWNQVAGGMRDCLSAIAGRVEKAYVAGIESALPGLLDQGIPQEAYALGRDVMKTLLNQERGFHGSHMTCDTGCGNAMDYEGDKDRTVTTRLGDVPFRRSYYCCSSDSCDHCHPSTAGGCSCCRPTAGRCLCCRLTATSKR